MPSYDPLMDSMNKSTSLSPLTWEWERSASNGPMLLEACLGHK